MKTRTRSNSAHTKNPSPKSAKSLPKSKGKPPIPPRRANSPRLSPLSSIDVLTLPISNTSSGAQSPIGDHSNVNVQLLESKINNYFNQSINCFVETFKKEITESLEESSILKTTVSKFLIELNLDISSILHFKTDINLIDMKTPQIELNAKQYKEANVILKNESIKWYPEIINQRMKDVEFQAKSLEKFIKGRKRINEIIQETDQVQIERIQNQSLLKKQLKQNKKKIMDLESHIDYLDNEISLIQKEQSKISSALNDLHQKSEDNKEVDQFIHKFQGSCKLLLRNFNEYKKPLQNTVHNISAIKEKYFEDCLEVNSLISKYSSTIQNIIEFQGFKSAISSPFFRSPMPGSNNGVSLRNSYSGITKYHKI